MNACLHQLKEMQGQCSSSGRIKAGVKIRQAIEARTQSLISRQTE